MWPLIDILQLHHPNDTEKSSIRAFGGNELNELFREILNKLSVQLKMSHKKIAKEIFKVNPNSVQSWKGLNKKYPNGHPIPIWVLAKSLELLNLKQSNFHRNVVRKIKQLQCGRVAKRINAVIYLTPNLVRLCGAHAADGCLNAGKNKGPITARWDIGDQEKSNIEVVKDWVQDLFEIKLHIKQKGKMYYTWTNMQVIARYLIQIFGFPIGEKSHTIEEPKVLSENDSRILSEFPEEIRSRLRLEFAKEVINFDGHSTETGGTVLIGLGSESSEMRKNIIEILSRFGIKLQNYNYEKGSKISTTSKEETQKLYSLGIFRGQKREKLKMLLTH